LKQEQAPALQLIVAPDKLALHKLVFLALLAALAVKRFLQTSAIMTPQ